MMRQLYDPEATENVDPEIARRFYETASNMAIQPGASDRAAAPDPRWILGATAAQDAYQPAGADPWTATNPYRPGSEPWQFFEDSRANAPSDKPVPTSLADMIVNTGRGIAGTAQAAGRWLNKPAAEGIADIGSVAKGIYDIPQKAYETADRYSQGGAYDPGPILNAAMLGTSGGLLGGTGGEAGAVLQAGMRRGRRLPPPPAAALEANPRAVIGGNMPPEAIAAETPAPPVLATPKPGEGGMGSVVEPPITPPPPPKTWAQGLPRPAPAAKSTEIPSIRGMPVQDAIDIARTQPHLIKSGEGSEGLYVGGPRNIQTKQQLNAQRKAFDEYVAADPRGGDWYERYRPALDLSTGGVPEANQMASAMHGQWSAGVDPGSELHYVLKELNSSIAGMPERANYGAQHRAYLNALAANDPLRMQLADKTDEYRNQISRGIPGGEPLVPGATGVNDFRYLRSWGYTEKGGEPQKGAPGDAAHRFTDMETALAVDRANRANLGGRSDWTGEQLQAAPWVRQKALDIQARGGKNEDGSFKISYDEAFTRANRTIADYYPSKTYNAPHEAQPGANTGHMTGSVAADDAARMEYFNDPASTWATAPLPEGVTGPGRDAIYAGLHTPGAPGNAMRVLPSEPMRGVYRRPDGVIENNPGEIAQPMGTFTTPREYPKDFVGPREFEPFKRTPESMRAILNAGEHLRAALDAQNAGSWHKVWEGGPLNQSNSLIYPRNTGTRAQMGELFSLQGVGEPRGLPDVTDTARGSLLTRWYPPPEGGKAFDQALRKREFEVPGLGEPRRVRVDSDLANLVDEWAQGEGSGAVTRKVLEHITATPELEAAFNNNPYLAERALAKYERDKTGGTWAGRWNAPREDLQNLRLMVADGPGWIDRVKAALRTGAVSLPAVAALMVGAAAMRQEGSSREGS
jgi:hypothetical protein